MNVQTDNDNETLSARVRRTLQDLAVIRKSLLAISEQPGNDAVASRLSLDMELASELKSVVDALRQLLWAYMQALSAQSGRTPMEVLSWYKMEIAVELLRSLRNSDVAQATPLSDFEKMVNHTLMVTAQYTNSERRC
jgi:hypothetical protein